MQRAGRWGAFDVYSALPLLRASHPQSVRRTVNRNASLICNQILSTCPLNAGHVFQSPSPITVDRYRSGRIGIGGDTQTDISIYCIRRCCNATSEYSPISCIGLTLLYIIGFVIKCYTHTFNGPLSERQRVAVASAGPYANLHLAPDR